MLTHIEDYVTASQMAKTFVKKNGEVGVTRHAIHLLIQREIEYPGTSGLDVLVISGHYYVRQSKKVAKRPKKDE